MKNNTDKILIPADDAFDSECAEAKRTFRVLQFVLGQELYCVDVREAKEVFRIGSLTAVPTAPDFIAGVANLRGDVIPVIDIRYFLGLPRAALAGDSRIILTDIKNGLTGVLVDGVGKTREIEEDAVEPPLATIRGTSAVFTRGEVKLEEGIMVVLNLIKILETEEIERLRKGGQ